MTDDGRRMTDDGRRMADDGNAAVLRPPSSVLCRLSSVLRPPSSVLRPLLLALLLVVLVGCGRKGPPFVPQQRDITARVTRLEGGWEAKSLVLKGLVPGDKGSQITGCRVYYVWYPLTHPPCEGCPIAMTRFRDVTDRIVDNNHFTCRLPAFRQKGICFVTVRVMEKGGRLGPGSDRIKLISER